MTCLPPSGSSSRARACGTTESTACGSTCSIPTRAYRWRVPGGPARLRASDRLGRPEVVIEIGTYGGGSALWLRDRLLTLAAYGHISRPHVISVDLHMSQASVQLEMADPRYAEEITLVEADILDPRSPLASRI